MTPSPRSDRDSMTAMRFQGTNYSGLGSGATSITGDLLLDARRFRIRVSRFLRAPSRENLHGRAVAEHWAERSNLSTIVGLLRSAGLHSSSPARPRCLAPTHRAL